MSNTELYLLVAIAILMALLLADGPSYNWNKYTCNKCGKDLKYVETKEDGTIVYICEDGHYIYKKWE